jgi:hypothetical protein
VDALADNAFFDYLHATLACCGLDRHHLAREHGQDAVWKPSPVPTCRTRSLADGFSGATMLAIRLGWVVTCSWGIRIGASR